LNNGGGTADLQLQGGDDCKWDQCAIGACVEKGVNCGAGEWGLPVRTCELYENNWSLRNAGFQGLIGILHGMEALGKSSATNHDSGFLFEHLADEQVLVRALGKNPMGEGLFVGIVVQDDAILECDKFAGIGDQKLWFGDVKERLLPIEVCETLDRDVGCDVCMARNRHGVQKGY